MFQLIACTVIGMYIDRYADYSRVGPKELEPWRDDAVRLVDTCEGLTPVEVLLAARMMKSTGVDFNDAVASVRDIHQ